MTNPRADCQALTEASYINLPTITVWLRFSCCVDVAIQCNKRVHSVGLIWWLMGPEVLHIHGTNLPWVPSLQGCWRRQEGRTSRVEKSYDQGKDVWSNETHHLFSSHTNLMLYGCLLSLRSDLELALLRPLNKLQQPLELFFRHLNKRKEDRWKKIVFLKKK